jgi:hypothetical protein
MATRTTRRITKGDILRDNIYSTLIVVLLAVMAWQYLRISIAWRERGVTVTVTTTAIQDSSQGPVQVIEWQANGRTYSRQTTYGPNEVGKQMDATYLPEAPERALPFLEMDKEPERIIGAPAVIAFALIGLFKLWLIYYGPRRKDDRELGRGPGPRLTFRRSSVSS